MSFATMFVHRMPYHTFGCALCVPNIYRIDWLKDHLPSAHHGALFCFVLVVVIRPSGRRARLKRATSAHYVVAQVECEVLETTSGTNRVTKTAKAAPLLESYSLLALVPNPTWN
jgi:hypothetical protein